VRTVAGVEGRSASLSAELQRLRVLLLDDNTMTRQHLVDVFQAWSVTVDTAATETASIESLRHAAELRQPVDLLVVDDKTVRKEQLGDFIAEIRRMSGLRSCKKFYIANPENALSDTEGTRLGVDHCLTKPVCQSALLGAVNNYCIEAGSIHAPVAVPLRPLRASAGMFGKARVLLAEDNPINQQVAQEILRQAGVECRVVENGRQALEAVARERFDLILMDCQMPEMDGFIATQRIREMEASAELPGRVPVIALTANAIKGDRERCLAAGMDDYVSKPFEVDSLLATIGRFLSVPRKPANTGPGDAPKNLLPPLSGDPPIDRKVLLGHCSENLQFAHHLLSDFAKEMPRRFQRIAEFVGQGDAPAASEVAHSLKGAAGILAATAVQAASAEIEAAGKAGDIAKMMPLVEKLRDAIRRCQEFIPEIQTTLIITEEAQYAHATT
jgi:CheY-like chemotaxis protein